MRLLRRFLRHLCPDPIQPGDRPLEMLIGDLKVMLSRDRLTVPDPLADDVNREGVGEFRLTGAAEVLKGLRPRLQARPTDDPVHLCA